MRSKPAKTLKHEQDIAKKEAAAENATRINGVIGIPNEFVEYSREWRGERYRRWIGVRAKPEAG